MAAMLDTTPVSAWQAETLAAIRRHTTFRFHDFGDFRPDPITINEFFVT
jgi:hypothetical protein